MHMRMHMRMYSRTCVVHVHVHVHVHGMCMLHMHMHMHMYAGSGSKRKRERELTCWLAGWLAGSLLLAGCKLSPLCTASLQPLTENKSKHGTHTHTLWLCLGGGSGSVGWSRIIRLCGLTLRLEARVALRPCPPPLAPRVLHIHCACSMYDDVSCIKYTC